MKKLVTAFASAALIGLFATTASALPTLVGDDVTLTTSDNVGVIAAGTPPLVPVQSTTVVDPGVEFDVLAIGAIFLDVGSTSLTLTIPTSFFSILGDPSGILTMILSDIDAIVVGALISSSSFDDGTTSVSFTDHTVTLNIGDQAGEDETLVVDLQLRDAIVAVPEPATLAVLGLGLVGLGLVRRRRAA